MLLHSTGVFQQDILFRWVQWAFSFVISTSNNFKMKRKKNTSTRQSVRTNRLGRTHKGTAGHTDTNLPFALASSLGRVFLVVFVIQVVQEVVGLQDSLLTRR